MLTRIEDGVESGDDMGELGETVSVGSSGWLGFFLVEPTASASIFFNRDLSQRKKRSR